jgi:hypothetical protein
VTRVGEVVDTTMSIEWGPPLGRWRCSNTTSKRVPWSLGVWGSFLWWRVRVEHINTTTQLNFQQITRSDSWIGHRCFAQSRGGYHEAKWLNVQWTYNWNRCGVINRRTWCGCSAQSRLSIEAFKWDKGYNGGVINSARQVQWLFQVKIEAYKQDETVEPPAYT